MGLTNDLEFAREEVRRLENAVAQRSEPIDPASMRDWLDEVGARLQAVEEFCRSKDASLADACKVFEPDPF